MRGRRVHVLYSLYKRYKSRYLTWAVSGRHHTARISPFQLLYVKPDSIRLLQERRGTVGDYPYAVSEVKRGDWDQRVSRFRQHDLYQSFDQHFNDNVPWIRTPWVQRVIREIDEGLTVHSCSTIDEFLDQCAEINELYARINDDGYRTQKELLQSATDNNLGHWWTYFCPNLHEIIVNIDRKGRFIFEDGWRRFAVADVLDVPKVPVRVNVRHYNWQVYRDNIAKGDGLQPETEHPDIVGI